MAHASLHAAPQHVAVIVDEAAAEVRAVDLYGNAVKRTQMRRPISSLSVHGDLLCASHGWGLTRVVDMATGAVVDEVADGRKKVNAATPFCLLGHVPATGEYKVLRIQADYCNRRHRQTCEVMTLGGGGAGGDGAAAGRWRRRAPPPVSLAIKPFSNNNAWKAAVVAGLAYFLTDERFMEGGEGPDRLAVFDLAAEAWKPATLHGPLTSRILVGDEDDDEDDDDDDYKRHSLFGRLPPSVRVMLLGRQSFQLARLGVSLAVLYCNVKKGCTELWFMEDMEMTGTSTARRWSKRYALQGTRFGGDKESPFYHYPLAVLDDMRILVLENKTFALRAYDRETCAWTDMATLTGDCIVGLHHGMRPVPTTSRLLSLDCLVADFCALRGMYSYIGVVFVLVFSFIYGLVFLSS